MIRVHPTFKPLLMTGALSAAFLLLVPGEAGGISITAVSAPNLNLPNDGVLHTFTISVNGTWDPWEINVWGGALSFRAEYWDKDVIADDPIDLHPAHTPGALNIPAPPAAAVPGVTLWGPINIDFRVGCHGSPCTVFGPDGETGENPMNDGYFLFARFWEGGVANRMWGYNTVTCFVPPPPPPPPPVEEGPYRLKPVPEPGTATLLLAGLGGLVLVLRRW